MSMNAAYLNLIALAGADEISHIGLVDELGDEISGGSYARISTTWVDTSGTIRPDGNKTFDVPSGNTVAGWRGYNASSAGTDFGGEDLPEQVFASDGTYTLLAASTGIIHQAGSA